MPNRPLLDIGVGVLVDEIFGVVVKYSGDRVHFAGIDALVDIGDQVLLHIRVVLEHAGVDRQLGWDPPLGIDRAELHLPGAERLHREHPLVTGLRHVAQFEHVDLTGLDDRRSCRIRHAGQLEPDLVAAVQDELFLARFPVGEKLRAIGEQRAVPNLKIRQSALLDCPWGRGFDRRRMPHSAAEDFEAGLACP